MLVLENVEDGGPQIGTIANLLKAFEEERSWTEAYRASGIVQRAAFAEHFRRALKSEYIKQVDNGKYVLTSTGRIALSAAQNLYDDFVTLREPPVK